MSNSKFLNPETIHDDEDLNSYITQLFNAAKLLEHQNNSCDEMNMPRKDMLKILGICAERARRIAAEIVSYCELSVEEGD
jgi:hypothetical protein